MTAHTELHIAYAQALESLTSPRLSPRELKRRKRMIYQAKRGNVSGAKRIAQYLISRDLLTSIELLIFGREIELSPDPVIKQDPELPWHRLIDDYLGR